MKEIKAYIQPFMRADVLDALEQIPDLPGVTLSEVSGWGRTRGKGAARPVAHGAHDMAQKVKLEIVVPDPMADEIVETIAEAARTGKPGDGKIFVSEVGEAVRIRTGERGDKAI